MEVLSYRPDPAEFAWTFGGVPPVRRVRPGTRHGAVDRGLLRRHGPGA